MGGGMGGMKGMYQQQGAFYTPKWFSVFGGQAKGPAFFIGAGGVGY
jgi:hypothetical protein